MAERVAERAGYLAFLVAIWVVLALAGFPRPYPDDTIMVGPSIGLLQGHGLNNIYLSKNFYPDDLYLFYPPTYSWILYGWIKLFSSSAQSLSIFWASACITSSYFAYACFSKVQDRLSAMMLAPVLIFSCTAFVGYRMEFVAFATFFGGLYALSSTTAKVRAAGYFLTFATPTIAPTLLAFSFVAICVALASNVSRRELVRAAFGFGSAVVLLFAVTLGEVSQLVATMYAYKDIRIALGGRQEFFVTMIITFVLFMPFALISAEMRKNILKESYASPSFYLPILLVLGFSLSIISHARPSLQVAFNILAIASFTATVGSWMKSKMHGNSRYQSKYFSNVEAAPTAVLVALLVFFCSGYATFHSQTDLPENNADQVRLAASAIPKNKIVVVDVPVARAIGYPNNYRLEEALVRNPQPNFFGDPKKKKNENEVWIVSSSLLYALLNQGSERIHPNFFETALIATGPSVLDNEKICVIDRTGSLLFTESFDQAIAALCK